MHPPQEPASASTAHANHSHWDSVEVAAVKNTTLENKCQILLTAELQKQHTEIRTITPVLYEHCSSHALCKDRTLFTTRGRSYVVT